MRVRYLSRREPTGTGWTVYDRTTGLVAESGGVAHQHLTAEDADEVVEMLNAVASRKDAVARKASRMPFRVRERYYAYEEDRGWAVYDSTTGRVAEISGSPRTGLNAADADDMVDMLNRIEASRP